MMGSLEVLAQIPTDTVDYWIGNISPRCAINILYFNFTDDFNFNSTHNIPVILAPLNYYPENANFRDYLPNHKFYNSLIRFIKAECYFSILYYKLLNNSDTAASSDDLFLHRLIFFIVNGFSKQEKPDSTLKGYTTNTPYLNSTFCLVLYNGSESKDEDSRFKTLFQYGIEMNLALVYLSNSSRNGYNVYCRTPPMKFEVAALNVVNKINSIVDQNFMAACSSQYKFISIEEQYHYGVYDPERLVYEHKIVKSMLQKANLSMLSKNQTCNACPRVIVSDIQLARQTSLFFPTFDNSIRFFTCYSLPVLSFHFYVSAFEIRVWIAIILSGVLLATFLKCHIYYNLSKTLNFCTFLFYFSIFMEETYSIPLKIRNNTVYRTATILWLLTAIVLTNSYISHVISGLNAPLAGKKLGQNDLYGNLSKEPEIKFEPYVKHYGMLWGLQRDPSRLFNGYLDSVVEKLHLTQNWTSGYTILSEPFKVLYPEDVLLHLKNPFIYSAFKDYFLHIFHCHYNFHPPDSSFCRSFNYLMSPSNRYYPAGHTYKRPWNSSDYPTGAVEEELINCKKLVYMERSDQLEFKYMSENYRKKRFYYLEDKLPTVVNNWGFYYMQKSKVPFYFSMFLQSGIFHELHKIKLWRDHLKRRSMTSEIIERTHKPDVLDMSSSVQTVFILFAAMTLLAKLSFVAELGYSACNKYNILFLKNKLRKLAFGAKFACYTLYQIVNSKLELF